MFGNKYSNLLTVILVIAIILVIGILAYWGYDIYSEYSIDKDAQQAIDEFYKNDIPFEENVVVNNTTVDNNVTEGEVDLNTIINSTTQNNNSNGNSSNTSSSTNRNKKTYKGYSMNGYIQITKTNISYPILAEASVGALEVAVAILYPEDAVLNQPGNVVIVGHNYRNSLFFSNNKKLVNGDKIYITDENGKKNGIYNI